MLYTSNGDGTYNVAIDFLHHKVIGDLSELRVDMYEEADTMKILIEVNDERYDISLVDFNKRYGQLIREAINNIDYFNSFVGLGIDIFEDEFWNKKIKFRKNLSNNISSSLRRNGYKINASQIKRNYIPKAIGIGSRVSSFVGVGCAIGSAMIEEEIKVSDIYAIAVASTAFIPVSYTHLVIIEPLPIKSRKAIHKVKDTLVILCHVGYGRRILGIGNQIDLSILLRRLLYYGREGLIHPRIECLVVLIQYRRACSVNGHSACLAHASNHFHLSDDSLEVITFTRLPMDK